MTRCVLDHVEDIGFDGTRPPITNLHALDVLPGGMFFAGEIVRSAENYLRNTWGDAAILGNEVLHSARVVSAFHWFAISATNYARLVALLGLMDTQGWTPQDLRVPATQRHVKKECKAYTSRVLPQILPWRNKIAAHFAATDPWEDDSVATLERSVMNLLSYQQGRLATDVWRWGSGSELSTTESWGVTTAFDDLAPRWWPGVTLPDLTPLRYAETTQ